MPYAHRPRATAHSIAQDARGDKQRAGTWPRRLSARNYTYDPLAQIIAEDDRAWEYMHGGQMEGEML